jgi:hypothetical protein
VIFAQSPIFHTTRATAGLLPGGISGMDGTRPFEQALQKERIQHFLFLVLPDK